MLWYNATWVTTFDSFPDSVPPAAVSSLGSWHDLSECRTPYFLFASWEMFCVGRRRQARVPLFRPLFFVDTGWRRRTCVHQTDMMLIMHGTASAWHLDMGDSIFFLLFFPFSVPLASSAAGAFTGVLGAGEERHHYTGRDFLEGGHQTRTISRLLAPFA